GRRRALRRPLAGATRWHLHRQRAGHARDASRLRELPGVDAALRAGELSGVQANEIASAAATDAGAEAELLGVARDDGVAGLRDTCRRVKADAAPDELARQRALHASRALRHWNDPDGAGRLDGRF